jgi:hypothetical protein
MEMIKYGSKIFTEPDVRNNQAAKSDRDIYAAALDNILKAMKRHRIFDRFGFNLPKQVKEGKSTVLSSFDEWEFDICCHDWINVKNESLLSGYDPLPELINLLENNINTTEE